VVVLRLVEVTVLCDVAEVNAHVVAVTVVVLATVTVVITVIVVT